MATSCVPDLASEARPTPSRPSTHISRPSDPDVVDVGEPLDLTSRTLGTWECVGMSRTCSDLLSNGLNPAVVP
eukprot:1144807-Amorphochlora_amoeboformis.AAC.1